MDFSCHLGVAPVPLHISGTRLRPQLPGFSHSCGACRIHLSPGSRFLRGSALSARVNRGLINGSQGVQSPGATVQTLPPDVFSQLRGAFAGVRSPTPLSFCPIPSRRFKTHLEKLHSLCPGLCHEVETRDVRSQRLEPEIGKD